MGRDMDKDYGGKVRVDSGATGSMKPVKGVGDVGMNYRGGEGGGMRMKTMDMEHGTNKGPMNVGKRSMEGGRRSEEHAFKGDRVHDEHLKSHAHSKTHISHAVECLKKEHMK